MHLSSSKTNATLLACVFKQANIYWDASLLRRIKFRNLGPAFLLLQKFSHLAYCHFGPLKNKLKVTE